LVGAARDVVFRRFASIYLAIRYTSPFLFATAGRWMYRRKEPRFIRHLVGGLHFCSAWYLLIIPAPT